MAAPNPVRIIPATSGNLRAGGEYVILDEFTTDRAAGAVNGTACEPGPGTRMVVDTEGKLTIAGGALTFAGGKASPAYGDPAIWFNAVVRSLGRVVKGKVNFSSISAGVGMLFSTDANQVGGPSEYLIYSNGTTVYTTNTPIATGLATATDYLFIYCLRTSGAFMFVRGGAFTYNTLIFVESAGTATIVYPTVQCAATTTDFIVDYLPVPIARWLPTPLVSDGFGSAFGTSDGMGHAEGVAGGIGAGGAGVTWSNAGGTWSVSGGKAINTPTLGVTELVTNGNMETGDPPTGFGTYGCTLDGVSDERTGGAGIQSLFVTRTTDNFFYAYYSTTLVAGTWYKYSVYGKRIDATFGYIRAYGNSELVVSSTFASSAWNQYAVSFRSDKSGTVSLQLNGNGSVGSIGYDDVSLKAFTLSELLSVSNLSCYDVLAGVALTRSSTSVQVGLALNWNSLTSPASGVIVYLAGGYINVEKYVAGTWSNVSTTAYTYSAGARLVVQKSGTSYRVYYNNALVKADTIADAGILSNTYHGLFSTDASNTFDDLAIYATGTSNEYAALDAF